MGTYYRPLCHFTLPVKYGREAVQPLEVIAINCQPLSNPLPNPPNPLQTTATITLSPCLSRTIPATYIYCIICPCNAKSTGAILTKMKRFFLSIQWAIIIYNLHHTCKTKFTYVINIYHYPTTGFELLPSIGCPDVISDILRFGSVRFHYHLRHSL